MGCDSAEKSPLLRREPSELAKLTLLAGGAYSFGHIPLTMFLITQQKVENDSGGLTKEAVSKSLTLFWVGWACAALTILPWADRFGRKGLYLSLMGLGTLASVVSSQARSVALYGACIFFIGLLLKPGGTIGYILMQESLPKACHATSTTICNVLFALSGMAVAAAGGTVFRDWSWRSELIVWHLPFYLILLIAPQLLKESPEFSAAVADPAHLVLQRLAKDGELVRRLFLTVPCWVACVVGFYGLSYSAGTLSDRFYLNLVLMSAVDIVGYGVAGPIMDVAGSRPVQAASFFLAALVLLLCTMLPSGHVRVGFALVGRLSLDVAFTTIYVLLLRCFPAEVRGCAMGTANFAARVAGLVTPLFALMPVALCCLIMASLCVVAAMTTLALGAVEDDEADAK